MPVHAIFDNIYDQDLLGLLPQGRVDAKKVAESTGLSKDDIAQIAGVSPKSVRYSADRIPQAVEQRLREIAVICNLVAEFFPDAPEKALTWFQLPNPMFGNVSPRDMIRFGRYEKLMAFVMSAKEEALAKKVATENTH